MRVILKVSFNSSGLEAYLFKSHRAFFAQVLFYSQFRFYFKLLAFGGKQ